MRTTFLTVAMTIFLAFSAFGVAQAQEVKIAVVDVRVVFDQLPQSRDIAKTIELEFEERMNRLREMEEEMTKKQEQLQRDEAIMSQDELQKSAMDLQQMYQEYQERREVFTEQLQRRRNEERNRVLGQIQQVINDLAERDGYDVVLESGSAVFVRNQFDITEKVLERMTRD